VATARRDEEAHWLLQDGAVATAGAHLGETARMRRHACLCLALPCRVVVRVCGCIRVGGVWSGPQAEVWMWMWWVFLFSPACSLCI